MKKPPAKTSFAATTLSTASTLWRYAPWITRIIFAVVFFLNIQCALQFIITPNAYLNAYELSGASGTVAIQGLGVAFLMWNTTYPLYLVQPTKYRFLGIIILVQQAIGLIGESIILLSLPLGHEMLAGSIIRFICFDAIGLIAMSATYLFLYAALKRSKKPRMEP